MAALYWTRAQAIALCRDVEGVAPEFGCHVALTGGLLYKDGDRKDCDLLFYRIRQVGEIDFDGLFKALSRIGIERTGGFGWVIKAMWRGQAIDCFFPEVPSGDYNAEDDRLPSGDDPFPEMTTTDGEVF